MFNQGFRVSGASLSTMRPGERGVVSKFKAADSITTEKLRKMGLQPGMPIVLEQRFPSFVVKTGSNRLTLDDRMIRSIYVRLAE